MSYRDRDRRRDRDDFRGGDRYGGGGGYGGGRDGFGGRRDGGGFGGGRDNWDRRDRDGGRRFGGGGGGGGGGDRRRGGGGGGDRRSGGFGRGGGGGGGGRGGGGGGRGGGGFGGGGRRDGKRMGGSGNGPPSKRFKEMDSNWNEEDRHGLMQSVFMETKPENFAEEWLCIVCPPGKRRLLVAANESTESYNNAGARDLEFISCLPSGSEVKGELDKMSDLTILDTVYSAEKKMFYVVDLLHWKHYPYYDTEADFRCFCLNDKWTHLTNPDQISENNEHPLHKLEKHECSDEKIVQAMTEYNSKIEGLLFVKKNSIYRFRETTDCLWLKLDKMEDVLGIAPPEGVTFAASNTKDEKRLQEQEIRKKQFEQRVAARARKEKEAKEAKEKAEKGETEGGEEEAAPQDGGDHNGDQVIEQEQDQEAKEEVAME